MRPISYTFFLFIFLVLNCASSEEEGNEATSLIQSDNNEPFLSYTVNPDSQQLAFHWKDDKGNILKSFKNLKTWLNANNEELVFAMNGGMFTKGRAPLGLYIENGQTLKKVNRTKESYGNFYLQPNGIFYLTNDNKPVICKTTDFKNIENIKYATQSGPLLLINGKYHRKLNKGSTSVHFRNGVGILPNGNLIFAMSKQKVNFYDFATFFKEQGCKNALYLDGFVSKTYLPEKGYGQLNSSFGVMIAVSKKLK
jgi:uncharacterized protein YigE (DUF2233 family)